MTKQEKDFRGDGKYSLVESEALYRALIETTDTGYVIMDREGRVLEANQAYASLSGYSHPDEIIGRSVIEWTADYDRTKGKLAIEQCFREGSLRNWEIDHVDRDGNVIPMELNATVVELGGTRKIVALCRDIRERRRAEQMLRQSERNYREIFNATNDAIFVHDADTGAILDVNDAVLRLFGFTREEALRLSPDDSSLGKSPYSAAEARQWVQKALQQGPQVFEWRARKKSGELFWVEVSLRSADISGQRRILAVVRDITDRKRAEEEVFGSRQMLQLVLDNIPQRIFWKDLNSVFLGCNKALAVENGYAEPSELIGKTDYDIIPAAQAEYYRAADRRVMETDRPELNKEVRHTLKDGSQVWYTTNLIPLHDKDGRVIGVLGTYDDITDRKRAEEALRESENRFRRMMEQFPFSIQLYSPDGQYVESNEAFKQLWGVDDEDLKGYNILKDRQIESLGFMPVVQRAFAGEQVSTPPVEYDAKVTTGHGRRRIVQGNFYPLRDSDGAIRNIVLIHQDITDRIRAEDALRASEALLRTAGRTARFGGWSVTLPDRQVTWSEQVAVAHGKEPGFSPSLEEAFSFYAPEWRERITTVFWSCAREGIPFDEEMEIITARGERIWSRTTGEAVRDESGTIIRVQGSFQDITDRKRAEEAVKAEKVFTDTVIESIPITFYVLNREGRYVRWNKALEDLLGVTSEQLPRMKGIDTIYEEDRELIARKIEEVLEKKGYVEAEARSITKGTPYYLLTGRTVDIEGQTYIVGTGLDITERKRAEEGLRRRSEELMALNGLMERVNATLSLDEVISVATDTIASLVQSDVVMFFMREGENLILRRIAFHDPDAPREEIPMHHVGKCLCGLAVTSGRPVYSDDIHADTRCTMEECRRMGFKSFAALPLQSGQEIMGILGLGWRFQRNVHEYSAFLETIAGQVAAACRNAILHKQVQEHAAELELRVKERTAQLEAANKELEAFSYSVSHDLRAPLRAIDGFSHVLLDDYRQRLDAEGQDYLSRVRQNCQRMAQLIDDMLSLSRVTRSEINRRNVDLAVLAKDVASVLQATDPTRQVEWMLPTQMRVQADENLMRIVLENLLGNAWKFTRHQSKPRIELGEHQEGTQRVFFVRDNGAGFDMAYVGKLFSAFQRLHSTREFEGTGIGLAIVQRIIHRHGGRIWAEGRVGEGATFFFTLP